MKIFLFLNLIHRYLGPNLSFFFVFFVSQLRQWYQQIIFHRSCSKCNHVPIRQDDGDPANQIELCKWCLGKLKEKTEEYRLTSSSACSKCEHLTRRPIIVSEVDGDPATQIELCDICLRELKEKTDKNRLDSEKQNKNIQTFLNDILQLQVQFPKTFRKIMIQIF